MTWADLDSQGNNNDDDKAPIDDDWLSKSIKKNVTDWRKLVNQKDSRKDLFENNAVEDVATDDFLAIEASLQKETQKSGQMTSGSAGFKTGGKVEFMNYA